MFFYSLQFEVGLVVKLFLWPCFMFSFENDDDDVDDGDDDDMRSWCIALYCE